MHGSTGVSVALAILFTCVTTVAEVLHRSRRQRDRGESAPSTQMRLRSCLTGKLVLYWIIVVLFNIGATSLAAIYLPTLYPNIVDELGMLAFFLFALAGVFVFQGVIANTNIIVFNKGILAFQNWLTIARAPAVAAAIEKQATFDSAEQEKVAQTLCNLLSEEDLSTRLSEILGKEEAESLARDAEGNDNPMLYKLLWLARRHPAKAEGIRQAVTERDDDS